jgi:hypothetical protein
MRVRDFVAWALGALAYVWITGCRVIDPGDGAADAPIGFVYLCAMDAGQIEVCYDGDPDDIGRCRPTPRHAGLCLYHCSGGRGCNALQGCWCPP